MNKKGSILDIFLIIVFLFVGGISIVVIGNFWTQMRTSFVEEGLSTRAITFIDSTESSILNFDNVFLIIAVGLIISTIILAFTIHTHPIFFFISIILLMFALVVAPPLSNAFRSFINETDGGGADFNTTAANYPQMIWIVDNLPLIAAFVPGVGIIIALFLKFIAGGTR